MIPQDERRVTFPEDVWIALEKVAANEKKRQKNPLIAEMITPKSWVQHLVKDWVRDHGYWEPKEKPGS